MEKLGSVFMVFWHAQSLRGYGLLEISQKPTLHFETLEIGAKKQLNGVIDKRINNVYFQYFWRFFFWKKSKKRTSRRKFNPCCSLKIDILSLHTFLPFCNSADLRILESDVFVTQLVDKNIIANFCNTIFMT